MGSEVGSRLIYSVQWISPRTPSTISPLKLQILSRRPDMIMGWATRFQITTRKAKFLLHSSGSPLRAGQISFLLLRGP
jgi:hypothetical protein